MSDVDYIGYGCIEKALNNGNPLIQLIGFERKHKLIIDIIELVNLTIDETQELK